MSKSFFKKRGVKAFIWVAGIAVVLFVGLQIFMNAYLPGLIRNRVTYLVVNGSDSLYRCSIGDISVSLVGGVVSIKDINIAIDSNKYKQLEKKEKLPDVIFEAKLLEGSITGLRLLPFLFYKKIRLNTIKAQSADIAIYSLYDPEKERMRKRIEEIKKQEELAAGKPEEPISEQQLWQLIEPEIKGIFINWVFLDHVKFSYKKAGVDNIMTVKYNDLSASLRHIRIDSTGASDQSRILFTEDLSFKFSGLQFYTPDSLYKLNMDTMMYSSSSRKVFISGFGVSPTLSPADFTKKIGQQVDIFEVKVPEIAIFNFQIDKIFSENAICIDTVTIEKPLINIYHDRTASPDTVVKYGQYPNETILAMPVTLKIPVVILYDSELHYIEKQAVTYVTGDGFFTHVSGTLTNVTNDSTWLAKNSHMVVNMDGYFLHSAKLSASFDFDLGSADGSYTAKADMGKIGAKELNLMTIPFGNLEMKTADLKEAHFRLKGNTYGTTGTLRMLYKNLTVELLMKGKKDHKMKKDKFMTFLANLVGVRKNNPSKRGKETIAQNITVKRTPQMPFFNMIWKTLFGGMKDVMLKGPAKKIEIGQE